MKRNLKLTLAAAAIASALASPAWSQPTTNVTGASTGVKATAPPATIGANADASAQARLRAECFNSTTNSWRTTGNCASVIVPPVASASSTYPTGTKPSVSSQNPGSLKEQASGWSMDPTSKPTTTSNSTTSSSTGR